MSKDYYKQREGYVHESVKNATVFFNGEKINQGKSYKDYLRVYEESHAAVLANRMEEAKKNLDEAKRLKKERGEKDEEVSVNWSL